MPTIDEARRALQERDGALERECEQIGHDIRVLDARRSHIEVRRNEIAFALDLLGPGEDPDFAEVPATAEPEPAPPPAPILSRNDMQQLASGPQNAPAAASEHTRKPRRDVRTDVRAHFDANPDATFTLDVLAGELDITKQSAQLAVQYWHGKGLLDQAGDHWYRRPLPEEEAAQNAALQSTQVRPEYAIDHPDTPAAAQDERMNDSDGIPAAGEPTPDTAQDGECEAATDQTPAPSETTPSAGGYSLPPDRAAGTIERRSGKSWPVPGAVPTRRGGDKERQIDKFHAAQAEALKQRLQKAGTGGIDEDEAFADPQVIANGIEAGWLIRRDAGDGAVKLFRGREELPF